MRVIRNLIVLLCAAGVLLLLPLLWSNREPIQIDIPRLRQEQVVSPEVQKQRQAVKKQHAAQNAKTRRIYACETDDDCVIVDKDPCGCLAGPSGVTAINVLYTQDFEEMTFKGITSSCPDTAPSTENECSDTARPVCQANVCKISYE